MWYGGVIHAHVAKARAEQTVQTFHPQVNSRKANERLADNPRLAEAFQILERA